MKFRVKHILFCIVATTAGSFSILNADLRLPDTELPEITLIPEDPEPVAYTQDVLPADTGKLRYSVAPLIPGDYNELGKNHPVDLATPENLSPEFQFNPVTNRYELRSKIGDMDIVTPLTLTREEYLKYSMQRSMDSFFRGKYNDEVSGSRSDEPLSAFDFKFDLGPAEKLFGPGGVKVNAQGSTLIKMGVTNTRTGNPTLSERQRNQTSFDFDTQVQANISASVGDKINFDLNYNTESTFDFDSKKLKLGYTGKEDEILKTLEFGNVSMNTTNSLIRGGTALFGIKTEMQFGKLTVGAIFSQQESQSRTTSAKGNTQTDTYEITADAYDNNTHFFLGHYFYDTYDDAMKTLPYINSGISIDRIEVWITNKRSRYDQARNIVAFTDLGEGVHIQDVGIVTGSGADPAIPSNRANTLYNDLISTYNGAREISQVNQVLEGTAGMENGRSYEKIENARKLEASEYHLNSQLGYISLRTELQADEVLAVAYSYTYRGTDYQVGEFSTDDSDNAGQNLFLKLLKGATSTPASMTWKLMMKNFYTLNSRGLTSEKFRMDVKYQNDTAGIALNYINEGKIADKTLLRVMRLDRLNSRNESFPDGFFDYVEGYTVFSNYGRIAFPVIEPFGSHLKNAIGDEKIADKYIFQELYDSTLTVARQTAEKNKFILSGEYKGSSSSDIQLDGLIARGSVTVTANGIRLKENVDYTVDYSSGNVTIINPAYENATINVSSENQANFSMQRKTMMGLNLNYAFNPKFNIGGTIMNLSEMPLTMKTNPGEEALNNTLFGFNINYAGQSQALTNLLDKLPFVELTAPSQISFNAEYAQLIAGHYENKYGGDYSYIDDFEQAKITIDLRTPSYWTLSSTPSTFSESKLVNDINYGKNRALLAWYYIDGLFTRKSSLTPTHIRNDDEQLSNHYVREVLESELFPNKDVSFNQSTSIPIFNLAYYPKERGPYNLDADAINPADGTLLHPESRWGGITRKIESGQTDFEAQNIETIEFWMMDPFIYGGEGGELWFNLGEISEDILKDEKKFFENGLPIDGDTNKVEKTAWGLVPTQQSLTYAFDNTEGARRLQDVGLNGLSTEQEKNFDTYVEYLDKLRSKLDPSVVQRMEEDQFSPFNDPAGDTYHYFRGSDYDQAETPILARYKRYNGTEGNSADLNDSPENYNTAAKLAPDIEDINQDNTMNESEKYFQYRVRLHPDSMKVGENYIVQKMEVKPRLKNGKEETLNWYLFKIPLKEFDPKKTVGNIRDFKNIRFVRMFLTNFSDSTVLRFGTLQLVRGDWRIYTKDLSNPNLPPINDQTSTSMTTVNIEENGDKEPVNYIMPPGVNRVLDPGQTQLLQQNEQALSLTIHNLSPGDARAIYLTSGLDTRQYRRLQMFTHAEKMVDDLTDLQDEELSVFLRLGSDYTSNYYEYEIPLKLTPAGKYDQTSSSARETVWPESNMFNFPFKLLTDLKLERNKEKRRANSTVTFFTPYSSYDPDKPINKVSIVGNPSLSEVKVIMVGVRNNSRSLKSAEIWVNELRLTDFNEDGGWAANANLYLGLSDLGSVNIAGRKETAGFGGLDQGLMDRNLDDSHEINFSAQFQLGKFFPEKAKVSLPLYISHREEVVNPKYNPLDQDVLLEDALDAVETKAERDSILRFAQDKITTKSLDINNVRIDIRSKKPMPYDPANFTLSYSQSEQSTRNASTEYERTTTMKTNLNYSYAPNFPAWKPFDKVFEKATGANRFLKELSIDYLPRSITFNSQLSRDYYEIQLRDVANQGDESRLPVSFREEFYWNREGSMQWTPTKNINLNLNMGTNARIETPHEQVNKRYNPDGYQVWKDSVLQSIRDLGTPLDYRQTFQATYTLPFRSMPALNFISGSLKFNSDYTWERGATITSAYDEEEEGSGEDISLGNTIRNGRTIGVDNISFNLLNLYNKSKFLSDANKKYTLSRTASRNTTTNARRGAQQNQAQNSARERRNRKFEKEIQLNPDSATIVRHQLGNKRLRITARGADGKLYEIKHKAIDNNSIRIKNKDTVSVKLVISQLPPVEETRWYKIAQGGARALMAIRTVGFSYNENSQTMVPNFRPNIGDFNGQSGTPNGNAPGFDFAFGLTDGERFVERALEKDWLIRNEDNVTPAMFSKTETFTFTATVEPFAGLQINLNGSRIKTDQTQMYFMYDDPTRKYSGNFKITTVAISSAFEKVDAKNGYYSKTFEKFLNNRTIIANRLESKYAGSNYPNRGFLAGGDFANQPYNPNNGSVSLNSSDVLIPAFIAAYTGKDAGSIALTAFPSLKSILPNWQAKYDGLIQIPLISKHFKSFTLQHNYTCNYMVGAFNSFLSWVPSGEVDGIGFIRSTTTDNPSPSSPYDITAVSITEAFSPLFGLTSAFHNNASLKLHYNQTHNISLNISSYQIVEVLNKEFVVGFGYRFSNFNQILKIRKTGGGTFNNELQVAADFVFSKRQNLIRKIEDSYTQAQSGDSQTSIKLSADYSLSRMITLQAFFDRQISNPLVSTSAYPLTKTSFGVSCRVSLSR